MELHFLPVAGVSNGLELLKMFCQSVLYWRNNHFIGRNYVFLSFLGSMVHQECTSSNLEKADFILFHSLSFFFSFLIALLIPSRGGKIQSHYHFFIYKNKGNHLVLFYFTYLFVYLFSYQLCMQYRMFLASAVFSIAHQSGAAPRDDCSSSALTSCIFWNTIRLMFL